MIIAQISDPHITLAQAADGAPDAAAELERAVAHLLRLPARPDVTLVTGDCANGGTLAEYERFRAILRPLPMPVYVVPGNHDDRRQMLEIFGPQGSDALPGFVQYVADDGPVRLIALDTNVPQRNEGFLCEQQLEWLDARLAEAPDRPTILFMHHPPFLTGMKAMDEIGLTNADAFGAIVARHPQVERIVAGHIHLNMLRRFAGTLAMTCSATTRQMLPDLSQTERLEVVLEPPSCLLHTWRDGIGLMTCTSVIGEHGPAILVYDGEKWVV